MLHASRYLLEVALIDCARLAAASHAAAPLAAAHASIAYGARTRRVLAEELRRKGRSSPRFVLWASSGVGLLVGIMAAALFAPLSLGLPPL
jgi:hypothetical protein